MSWVDSSQIVGYSLAAVVAVAFLLPAALDAHWGCPPHGMIRVYRTLPWVRLFVGAIGLWRLTTPWLMDGGYENGWVWNAYIIILGALFGLPMLIVAAQRYELRLDMSRRTYRITQGWMFYPKVRSGPWDDFAGVFVRYNRIGQGQICSVGLVWATGGGKNPILSRYGAPKKAEVLAAEVSDAMNMPRVSSPEGAMLFIL